jgi:ABC-type hemin transport system ATPase subunit
MSKKPTTQIEALAARYLELWEVTHMADNAQSVLDNGKDDGNPGLAHRLSKLSDEAHEQRDRVLGFMTLQEPETAADTLICAVMLTLMLDLGKAGCEDPDARHDLKLAEAFAYKVVRGIERVTSLPLASLGFEFLFAHDTARPFSVRADECRDVHKRLVASGRLRE